MGKQASTARFTFLIDPGLKERFERLCSEQDITPSEVMRQMVKARIESHGTEPVRPPRRKRARRAR